MDQSEGHIPFGQHSPTTIFLPVDLHQDLQPVCMARNQCSESLYREACCMERYSF
jgi:hypothetical protein